MNRLFLTRHRTCDYGTFGTLELDTSHGCFHLCHTLEPAICDNSPGHGVKAGTYDLMITYSPKFNRQLPLISVPGRDGIRIHAGNTAYDTQGCIIPGLVYTRTSVLFSRQALRHVCDVIKELKLTKITISSL